MINISKSITFPRETLRERIKFLGTKICLKYIVDEKIKKVLEETLMRAGINFWVQQSLLYYFQNIISKNVVFLEETLQCIDESEN